MTSEDPPQSGANLLWECLRLEGVETVFGYPGGAILPVYDALLRSPIHHILARHEQGAAHMADGYARASGKVGVVIATSGPGATNLVTGLATAMLDSVPLVAITGQVTSQLLGTDAFQEVDVTGITLPITKHNYLVRKAADIAPALREAFALARSGRPGPVLVDITKDAQLELTTAHWKDVVPYRHLRHRTPEVTPSLLDRALSMIQASHRPLILAGHGVILSGASQALKAFAEKAQIPVASTLLGLGAFPANHPLSLGFMGMHGAPWVNHAIQEADLLLAFGMRFDDRVTGTLATYAPHARKIHVEIDASEFNKNVPVDLALHGDLRDVLEQLLPGVSPQERSPWVARLEEAKAEYRSEQWPEPAPDAKLSPIEVIRELSAQTPGAVVVSDVGQHQMWQAQVWQHQSPHTLITSGGLGTMGFALPAAIGAKMACPDAEVWVVAGDGGIQMNIQELMTLVQEGLKINIAVLNNGTLGMVRQWQTLFHGDRRSSVAMPNPDFVLLAQAYGLKAIRAASREEGAEAIRLARACPEPTFIEFCVDADASVYPIVAPGCPLDDMIHAPVAEFS
jgi:acetolactate synthase-1/2/3 large subunit